MTEKRQTILIVEDDLDVAEMLNAYLGVQGYEVHTVNWGEDALKTVRHTLPDLIILDIRLPDIDGYEVAKQLRAGRRTADVPIIFLTEKRQRTDRLKGLELGGDDYITKPFDIQELRLRVRNSLRRLTQGPLTNPITSLPDGPLVDEKLREVLNKGGDWTLMVVSIANLDAFRDSYGFVASDDVLRAISLMVSNSVRDEAGPDGFVGHLSTTNFVIAAAPGSTGKLAKHINSRLEQAIEYFYPVKDREPGSQIPKRIDIRTGVLQASEMTGKADIETLKSTLARKIVE